VLGLFKRSVNYWCVAMIPEAHETPWWLLGRQFKIKLDLGCD